MGFRENNLTVAERLKDVVCRNYGGKQFEIQYRPHETFLGFYRDQWSKCALEGIFHYLGIHMKDWLKEWDISLDYLEIHWNEEDPSDNTEFDYYPKKYSIRSSECPEEDSNCGYDCSECKKNVALKPICRIHLFIKPEVKDCKHSFIHRKDWEMNVCEHYGYMIHVVNK